MQYYVSYLRIPHLLNATQNIRLSNEIWDDKHRQNTPQKQKQQNNEKMQSLILEGKKKKQNKAKTLLNLHFGFVLF